METFLLILFICLIVQRIGELLIAHSNRQWMMRKGAVEFGQDHYKYFIILHTLFFLSVFVEYWMTTYHYSNWFWLFVIAFLLLQTMRISCILTLGKRWNTGIIVLPGDERIQKGMYRYLSHPNYVIVFFELLFIPLLFHAYVTALIFPFLHLLLLRIRIPAEEQALHSKTQSPHHI